MKSPVRPAVQSPLDRLFFTPAGQLVLLGLIGIFLFLPIAGAAGFLAYFQAFERIVPGVAVGDTSLSGASLQTAAIRIHQQWNLERKIVVGGTVNGQIKTWQVEPGDLGLSVDAVATARKAYAVAHNQSWINAIDQTFRSTVNGWGIAPVAVFDREKARAGLEILSAQIAVPPVNASLVVEGGQISETPAVPGISLDVETTLDHIAQNPLDIFLSRTLVLSVVPVEPEIRDVSALKGQIEQLLNTTLTISAYDPISDEHFEWQVPQDQLRSWIRLEPGESGPEPGFATERVNEYLKQLSSNLGDGRYLDADGLSPENFTAALQNKTVAWIVKHRATSYTVQSGDTLLKIGWKTGMPYWRIVQANPNVKPDRLQVGQELVIPSKDDLLALPAIPNKRIVVSISQQRLWTYENGQQRSESIISTGIDRSPTQPGIFQVQTHELSAYASEWDLTMPHFLGIYEAWPGFMNGFHGLPTLSNGKLLWESILGKPASFGCIILKLKDAEDLYNWAENGVVVEIQP